MINYYVYTTILLCLLFLFGQVTNRYVFKRKRNKDISAIERMQDIVRVAFIIVMPVMRWSVVFAVYMILFYSDEQLQEIVDKNRKEK